MPVGYGYDKNTQPLFIDWSEISKSFTDEIKARKEKGEAEKQSILDNRQEFDKLLVDIERNLEPTNRDRFTQRVTAMRNALKQFVVRPND